MVDLIQRAEITIRNLEKLNKQISRELKDDNTSDIILSKIKSYTKDFWKLKEEFENYKLKIPLIGHFSSGKSSLINSFLGYDILDTDINPETDKPYEIFYSEEPIEEIEKIKTAKGELEIVRLGYKFPSLKEYRNLIIVDLPGILADTSDFASVDQEKKDKISKSHTLITKHYLLDAEFFVLVIDASRGTLSSNILEFIKIKGNTPFAIILNKEDKIPSSAKEKVKAQILKEISPLKPCVIEFASIYNPSGFKKIMDIANNLYPIIRIIRFRENFINILEKISNKLEEIKLFLNTDLDFMNDFINEIQKDIDEKQKNLENTIKSREASILKLIEKTNNSLKKFLLNEKNIEYWANNLDQYEKEVTDYINEALENLEKEILQQIEKMSSSINQILNDLERDINSKLNQAYSSAKNLEKFKNIDLKKIKEFIDKANKVKKLLSAAKLIEKLKRILELTKITSILSNPLTLIGGWILSKLINAKIKKEIKKANEEICKQLDASLKELAEEIEEVFKKLKEQLNLNEELKQQQKELEAIQNNKQKLTNFIHELENITILLNQINASIKNIKVEEQLCH